MSPPEISYTSTIELAVGSFFSISLCPRTVTNGVLDDKIDDQPFETFCTFTTIITKAPGDGGGDKPAPVITAVEPHPATITQQNGIKISWRSIHYELFNVRFAEQGHSEKQDEIDSPGSDGFFVLQPTQPRHIYIFKVQGCHSGIFGTSCSPFSQVTVTAARNTQSLRTFLSGVDSSNGIRSVAPGVSSVRSLMGFP